jgi:hypothetical protein
MYLWVFGIWVYLWISQIQFVDFYPAPPKGAGLGKACFCLSVDNARILEDNARIQEDNARILEDNARIQEDNARIL